MVNRAGSLLAASASNERATGRQAWGLLWASSRPLAAGVIVWMAGNALLPVAVVITLGLVVGRIPGTVTHGISSADGHQLIAALILAALVYGLSLIADPVGGALGTAASARITGQLQERLLTAVTGPVGVAHLEDTEVLDRLARAEGSLTGFFPGDAPVTWAGSLAGRLSGVIGCLVLAVFQWWLGLLLLVMWVTVRRVLLTAVLRQAIDLRGMTTVMRRSWYFVGVGTKARDAKEVRVFSLARFVAARFRREHEQFLAGARDDIRSLHRRAAACFLVVLAGYALTLVVITHDARAHEIGVRGLAILIPMLAVTTSAGSISYGDITLAWALTGLPDADRLEQDLTPSGPTLTSSSTDGTDGTGSTGSTGRAARPGPRPAGDRPRHRVALEGVHFRYPGGTADVLAGVDLELEAGRSTALVGVNGAGKSTLVSLLGRLRDPTAGRIVVDDVDLRDLDPVGWQRKIALMPQQPVRYPVSAYDNVAFGALEHAADRDGVERAARQAGFADVVPTLPDGWDTVLTRELPGGVDLSGGQWQRLALARALFATAHGARLLILDEPTAALDVRSEARFYRQFLDITAGLTTVVISHRFATVRQADTICVLDGGHISERGSHADLVAAGGTYARMYEVQAARFGAAR
ncbi:MAG: ABC transporter ATP-binding protein [Actinobacteria bacterium]|nr:ABC transporter ATP-binding protein [Actinomycetota bacterium]